MYRMRKTLFAALAALVLSGCAGAPEKSRFIPEGQTPLTTGEFSKDGQSWEKVTVPHS